MGTQGENGQSVKAAPVHDPVLEALRPEPPAWEKTRSPLTIAILGWARVSSQAREGSGYNLNKSELARGLALSGHRVYTLSGGMRYRLGLAGVGRTHVRKRESWGGLECFELINSPNLAPAAANFRNMAREMSDAASNRVVLEWLKSIGADVVHVHSLEGFALDLIAAIEATGVPVVVTLHNYWYACPQVDLLRHEREVCEDYEGGKKCVGCLPGRDAGKARLERALRQTVERVFGPYASEVARRAGIEVKPVIKRALRGQVGIGFEEPILNPDRHEDPEVALGFHSVGSATMAQRSTSAADLTTIEHGATVDAHEQPKDYARSPRDQNERVLANRDRHLVVLNEYGQRRAAGMAALAAASLVTPPSDYLRKVHVAMGLSEEKTRWVRLGQPHFDQINRRARRSPFYHETPWHPSDRSRPVRFAFLGTVRPNKGLEVLTRAIPLLDPRVRERCHFVIRALGHDFGFRKRLSRFPEVSVSGGYDLYQLISAAGEYDVGILSHIWLENSPLVLLENFHAGKMVLSSRLGGPVDWVKDADEHPGEHNGMLFAGGDEQGLARCIERIVLGEVVIPSPAEIHARTRLQSYPEHVREVEGIYREVLARKRGVAASATAIGEPKAVAGGVGASIRPETEPRVTIPHTLGSPVTPGR